MCNNILKLVRQLKGKSKEKKGAWNLLWNSNFVNILKKFFDLKSSSSLLEEIIN